MERLIEFINRTEVSIIISVDNKIYICDNNQSHIKFIIDLYDKLLYVNSVILDVFPERDFNALLEEIGVKIDITPYFDEKDDIKAIEISENADCEILMDRVNRFRVIKRVNKWEICFEEDRTCLIKYVFADEELFADSDIFKIRDIYLNLVDMVCSKMKLFQFCGKSYNKTHNNPSLITFG